MELQRWDAKKPMQNNYIVVDYPDEGLPLIRLDEVKASIGQKTIKLRPPLMQIKRLMQDKIYGERIDISNPELIRNLASEMGAKVNEIQFIDIQEYKGDWVVYLFLSKPLSLLTAKGALGIKFPTLKCFFRVNEDGYIENIQMAIETAKDWRDAQAKAYNQIMPLLDCISFRLDTCISIDQSITINTVTGQYYASIVNKRVGRFPAGLHEIMVINDSDIQRMLSLYREANNSSSYLYRFLCLYKIAGEAIPQKYSYLYRQAKELGINLVNICEEVFIKGEHKGKKFKLVLQKSMRRNRDLIAHFLCTREDSSSFIDLNDYRRMQKIENDTITLSKICVVGLFNLISKWFQLEISRSGSILWRMEYASYLQQFGKISEAEKQYAAVLQIEPHNAKANLNLGHIAKSRNMEDKALEYFKNAILADPKLWQAHHAYGEIVYKKENYSLAEDCFEKVLILNPRFAPVHFNLATLFETLGQHEKAKAHYEKTIELEPERPLSRVNYAGLLAKMGQIEKAKQQYVVALRLDPCDLTTLNNYGNYLSDIGKKEEAQKRYREALKINPCFSIARHNLAVQLSKSGKREEAAKHYFLFGCAYIVNDKLNPSVFNNCLSITKELGVISKEWRQKCQSCIAAIIYLQGHHEKGQQIIDELLREEDIIPFAKLLGEKIQGKIVKIDDDDKDLEHRTLVKLIEALEKHNFIYKSAQENSN